MQASDMPLDYALLTSVKQDLRPNFCAKMRVSLAIQTLPLDLFWLRRKRPSGGAVRPALTSSCMINAASPFKEGGK